MLEQQVGLEFVMMNQRITVDWINGVVDWHLPEALNRITLLTVGDILLEGSFLGIVEDVVNREGGSFLFAPTKTIFDTANVVLGNLENPLSGRGSAIYKMGPNFRASPKMVKILSNAGFDILGVANNHVRDYGDSAFVDTLNHLKNGGITSVGGGQDPTSALEPAVVKVDGVSFGILAFTYQQESVASTSHPGAANLDNPQCFKSLKALKDRVDSVIVYVHMDPEYSRYPAPHRIRMAHNFIDMGAEMVIGHHPHFPQGIEIYKGKLIAYSLGNFVFHTRKDLPLTNLGYMLETKLTREGAACARIIPYRINDCCQRGSALCQPVPLLGNDRENAMEYLKGVSSELMNADIVRLNWEEKAGIEMMAISKHILKGIIKRESFSIRTHYTMLLKYRYQSLLRRLLTGKIWKDIARTRDRSRAFKIAHRAADRRGN
jgi:poly-gamma-glutamate capsule biosynthesis protein CapA/YwtB (metallophosphatase superfamily)